MSESALSTTVNGLDEVPPIKAEPVDPLLDTAEINPNIIPKEFVSSTTNGLHEDSDCEDIAFFTQIEVDNTRKCLENTRLIIKDFETQLDWHLQQYMTLRNIFNPRRSLTKNSQNKTDDASKRQDLLSISQLSAIIANHPEGNKKFIKRKGPISNGTGGKRRRRKQSESEEEEESDFSDEDSEEYDEEFDEGNDSENVDDPEEARKPKPKKKARGKKGKNLDDDPLVVPKDEIEEEIHELIVPKEEKESDEDDDFEEEEAPPKKMPAKRGRKKADDKPKTPAKKTPAKGKRGQKKMETIDLTNMKKCKVVLNRIDEDSQDSIIEIKDEDFDRDELNELLQPKLITELEDFAVDPDKPILLLKDDNFPDFDFDECKTNSVVITFEESEDLPEFVFTKNVANCIFNGSIKIVHASVLDEHEAKN